MTTFKHPRGRTWRYDFHWKGHRYTGTTDQLTKADADLVESEIKKRLRQQAWGIAPVQREHTPAFADWAEFVWLHQAKRLTRPDILERTMRMVLAFFGRRPTAGAPVEGGPYHDLRLADPILDPDWLVKFEDWMDARGLSGSTKNTYRSCLSGMYKLAIRPTWRKKTNVVLNPVVGMERDRPTTRQVTISIDQLRAWILASPPHVRLAMAIGALAPKLRLASILALRWDTHFDRDLTFITNDQHKTIRSTGKPQVMPIDPQLRAILEPVRAAAKKARKAHVVLYRGQPVTSIKTALKRAAADAGVPYGREAATFHSLRHTMATMLAELGVPDEQRRLVMGHSDLRTTQGYTHLRPLHERGPLAQLSQAVQITAAVQGPLQAPAKRGSKKTQENRTGPKRGHALPAKAKAKSGKQLTRTRARNS